MLAVLLLGAVSGLPNQFSESILQAWFTDLGFTNTRIGLLMYVAMPYLLKPLWAPIIDRFAVPWLGRRRGWLLLFQLVMSVAIAGLAGFGAQTSVTLIAGLLFFIVFLSAGSEDIARVYERVGFRTVGHVGAAAFADAATLR